MTMRLQDLTPFHIRTMIKLDDGRPRDSVGRMMDELTNMQIVTCFKLAHLGLVEFRPGWRDTLWFRLTPAGRRVRDIGKYVKR